AHHYDDEFCNLLNVKLQPYYFIIEEEALIDSTQLVHPKLPQKFFRYKRGILSYTHFSELPDSVDVLGKTSRGEANFVRISYGKGYFFLHTAPLVFTNYGMLSEDNKDYVAAILSCLPMREEVIWDEYYKIGRERINTPLRFILSQESLRWAYYVSIAGLLLFVLFKTKRTQRIIPEIPPLKNTTLEFAETIGLLYYHHGDHKNLAQKMILFWKDYLRNHYYLRADTLDEQFAEELSQKTTISLEKIHNTLALIRFVESQPQITDETLIELYQKLDECKKAKHS
ncbi:MAG: hypothetical protein RMJ89_09350, partial [Flammeovirgaceae bacterium]|nr:hypothetical protein [Flammeovirgaceae bacterium]